MTADALLLLAVEVVKYANRYVVLWNFPRALYDTQQKRRPAKADAFFELVKLKSENLVVYGCYVKISVVVGYRFGL